MAPEIIEGTEFTPAGSVAVGEPYPRASWGGIFAGLVLVLAWQILLNLLGLGLGASALKTIAAGGKPSEGLTAATVIGWVVVSWFTLAAGGYVASRLSGSFREQDGALHGLAVWAAALLVSVLAVTVAAGAGAAAFGGAVSAIAKAGGEIAGATAGSAAGTGNSNSAGGAGLSAAATLLRPGNPADLSNEAAAQEIATDTARLLAGDSGVDRDRLIAVISAKAGISKEEAAKRLADWEQTAKQVKAKAEAAAQAALDLGRKAALWGFVALLLGAISAAIGGGLGSAHARLEYLPGD
jgi:hypothetical protein